jgi:hypothetical protein
MHKFILSGLLLIVTSVSHADIIARYAMGKEILVLSYRDARHIRVDSGAKGYSIINGDQATAIINQGNAQVVMDVDQVGGMLAGIQEGQNIAIPDSTTVTLVATGEFSDIAGFKGRVYKATDGLNETQLVLTDNAQVMTASDGLRHFFRRFATAMRNDRGSKLLALEHAFKDQSDRGVLYVQGGFKLLSISQGQRPDNYYTAPPAGFQFSMPNASR